MVATPMVAYGQTLTAMWDPSPPADDVTGYEVCVGTASMSCNTQRAPVHGTENSHTFAVQPGVLYYVAVRAVNAGGASPYSPEVRASIPSLAPPPNQTSTVNVPISALTLTASDPDGGTLRFSHTGLPPGLNINSSTGTITGTATTTGTFTVTVFVTDGLETTSRSFGWTVQPPSTPDSTAPTLAITSHVAGQTVTTSNITLSGSATDSGTGGRGISSVTVNGAAATGGTATGSNTANWSRNVSLVMGANTITVEARDGANNLSASQITINRAVAPVTGVSLTSTLSSPRQTGTAITFTATGSGGVAPIEYKYLVQQGSGAPQVVRNWSSTATYTWTPATAANYTVLVWARSGGVTTDAAQASAQVSYIITAPLSVTGVTSSVASPQNVGTAINFTATATGGTSPYQFKWWVQSGGVWTVAREWSTSPSLTWQPTVAGTYAVAVWARNAGVTVDASQALAQVPYVIGVAGSGAGSGAGSSTPLSLTSLTSSVPSPQNVGTAINFTATASGGTSPYQFKWWVQSGGVWTVAREWSTGASLTWQPTAPGTYTVAVWARNAGVTTDASQALAQVPYVIGAGSAAGSSTRLSITSFTSSVPSPQNVGTAINFTATASGGTSPYQFKWWVQSGGVWTVAREWSTSASLTWQPTMPGTYTVAVWARNAGVTSDASQAMAQVPYVIGAASPGSAGSSTPLSITSFTSSVASPQAADTTISFTAAVAGGTAPYQFKWWVKNGPTWTIAKDWSSAATLSWRPMVAGTYMVAVWARNAGVTDDASQSMAQVSYSITPAAQLAPLVMSLSSNVRSPQVLGGTVTFTAAATGGRAPYEFKWWVHDGSQWTVAREWGTSQTLIWQPARAGTYIVAAWVRNAGVTADASQSLAQMTYVFFSTTSGIPPVITSLTSSVGSPTTAGTTVIFNTAASGGLGTYQFKWWVFSGNEWSVAQNWSNASSFAWRPTTSGNYIVAVWVRNTGVTADASQALAQVNYMVKP